MARIAGVCILAISAWLLVMPAHAQRARVDTPRGTLEIAAADRGGKCVARFRGRILHTFDCSAAYPPVIIAHLRGPLGRFTDVVVIQEQPMGNACNGGPLHVLGFEPSGGMAGPQTVDFCGGADPVIRREGSQVVITFPGGPPIRGSGIVAPEVWIYSNGDLSRHVARATPDRDHAVKPVPTVTFAGLSKVTVATVRKITDGDVACYLELVDDHGRRFEEMGEFTFCGHRQTYLNRRVALTYGVERVIHEDCMGDPECRKTRRVVVIRSARVLP